jgi:hypothetical protein
MVYQHLPFYSTAKAFACKIIEHISSAITNTFSISKNINPVLKYDLQSKYNYVIKSHVINHGINKYAPTIIPCIKQWSNQSFYKQLGNRFFEAIEMLRYFSRILIFTLILTAPLSFCGDNCPDFRPAFEIKEICSDKTDAIVVQQRATASTPLPFSLHTHENSILALFAFLTKSSFTPDSFSVSLHDRAPPLHVIPAA